MRLFADEDAQATTEYVLILAVLVSLAILLVRDLIRPILAQFTDNLSKIDAAVVKIKARLAAKNGSTPEATASGEKPAKAEKTPAKPKSSRRRLRRVARFLL